MWLRLYQSASIWLVLRAVASADPQVDRAAGADRMAAHRQQDRGRGDDDERTAGARLGGRSFGNGLAERCALAKIGGSPDHTRAMLRAYGPGCDGSVIDAKRRAEFPTARRGSTSRSRPRKKKRWSSAASGSTSRPQDEMAEIEPSSRLYERNGALYMTVSVLYGVGRGTRDHADRLRPRRQPAGDDPLCDAQAGAQLSRAMPGAIPSWCAMRRRRWCACSTRSSTGSPTRSRMSARTMEELSSANLPQSSMDERRIPAARLTALLTRIGRTQTLLTKIRYSAVSTHPDAELPVGLEPGSRRRATRSCGTISPASRTDVTSLSEHASFLSDNLTFLLDASLGLISIEQNAAMKLFSWAAVVFLPPTLIAGIFGMNFHYMPELDWHYGYPVSLAVMLASAVGPVSLFQEARLDLDPGRLRRAGCAGSRLGVGRGRTAARKRRISERQLARDSGSSGASLEQAAARASAARRRKYSLSCSGWQHNPSSIFTRFIAPA